jgi:hypothetical protein
VFDIPESYYVPEGKCCLLSPQHWAKAHKKTTGWRAWETTDADTCTLFWLGGDKRLVIPISVSDNVATFPLAPGYERFTAFCAEAQIEDSHDRDPIIAQPAVATEGDDDGNDESYEDDDDWQSLVPEREKDDNAMVSTEVPQQSNQCVPCEEPTTTDFSLNGTTEGEKLPEVDIMEEDTQPTNLAAELLRIHHRMGHAPFAKLQEMAKQGALPGRLKNCPIPTCTACMYGKASRKKWRDKPSSKAKLPTILQAGERVSVDQMVSPIPGLIAQITGILTTQRYRYATVFVDQATRMGYVHLQKYASVEETLDAKEAFEAHASTHGISVKAYHADNGIFKANKWVESCKKAGQGLTFAGVNSHHENGIAERRIKEIQDAARTMLIHASRRWKMSVNAHLWPYAVRMASDQVNNLPRMQSADKRTPLQAFANSDVHTNLKHWHPFGSPVYVLENELQTQGIFGKWKSRSKLGIYLGKSPQHSRNVALVLNRETGHVSPQFHVKHDHCYHTVRDDQQKSPDLWMIKAGFVGSKELAEAAPTKAVRMRKAPNDPSARGWKRPRMAGEVTIVK